MFDFNETASRYLDHSHVVPVGIKTGRSPGVAFRVFKRGFDMVIAVVLLFAMSSTAVVLLILNPFFNPGPLFYRQERMGLNCKPFMALKFRSMLPAERIERGPFDALEQDRITRLGRIMRKTRLDELPQAINVLSGEMSLIGPRPDYMEHAKVYVGTVRGYRQRHAVRPGISGFAQIKVGYADGLESVERKVAADLHYIANPSIRFEIWIAWQTLMVVVMRKGI